MDLGAVEEFPLPEVDVTALVAMLGSVPVSELSGAALVNGVAAWQQALNMVQAAQAVWVRELEARTPDALRHVPDELACVLVSTKRHAENTFLRAWGTAQHPALGDAWAAGAVDARKVDVILDEIHRSGTALSAHEVDAVVSDAVDRAMEMTGPQLTRHVRAALIATGPTVAEERRVVERERRGVFLELAPDAMARLIAYLPAADATAAFTAIDALAGHAAIDGDERTIDQRRADAFSDVFTTILDRQVTPDGTPLPTRHGQRTALQVTVTASTLIGLDDAPAYLGSYGPIPAQVARELAQDATWRRLLTDPATGQVCAVGTQSYRPGADLTRTVQARDVTCTFPGCRQPSTRCEIDHRIPYDHARSPSGGDQTCEANLHSLCKHHHQAKTDGWWNVTYDRDTGVSRWTDRHGITSARHPVLVLAPPEALNHRRRSARRADSGDPPF
ncbi:DUF222 domain-containing protein [Cellulomonas sp.]|uniref:HNH endonuclease signature motif containing protein n=1 Tax=Cellulomonas sp. TaxID=40001 RepID=UPI003BACD1CE